MNILNLVFDGYTEDNIPKVVDLGIQHSNQTCTVTALAVTLPWTVLEDHSLALMYAEQVLEMLELPEFGRQNDSISNSLNIIGISEACGLIRLLLESKSAVSLNVTVVSACFDRARTPFGSTFSSKAIKGDNNPYSPTPAWFDWRGFVISSHHRVLICHGTKDLNPSTPFMDALSYYHQSILSARNVTLLQVGGTLHGYACLMQEGVFERIAEWFGRK